MNFWQKLKNPFFVLAPMADVTDAAFRRIIAKYGKPDVMWTEFVSTDGLCSVARDKLLVDFWYTAAERPIVAQIFGSRPENFYTTAQLIQELGFDGIDINMGCPDRNVEKQGGGASLMRYPDLAKEIIKETKRGAGPLPVSVKTRIGYNTVMIDEWIMPLLEAEPATLTIHARTRKEMSKVPAHWDILGDVVQKIHAQYSRSAHRPLIIGNGDAESMKDAQEKVEKYGVDGVMLGRAIFGNPFLFRCKATEVPLLVSNFDFVDPSGNRREKAPQSLSQDNGFPQSLESRLIEEKLRVMVEHTMLFEQLFAGIKNFDIMKKHYKAYVTGFDGAKELRVQLMACKTARHVADIIHKTYPSV